MILIYVITLPLAVVLFVLLLLLSLRPPKEWDSTSGAWRPVRASGPHSEDLWSYAQVLAMTTPYIAAALVVLGFLGFAVIKIAVLGDTAGRISLVALALGLLIVVGGRSNDRVGLELLGWTAIITTSVVGLSQ